MNEIEKEKNKLSDTINDIKQIIIEEKENLRNIKSRLIVNEEDLARVIYQKGVHISNLEIALDKPYFARIDFIADDDTASVVYIGKNGIIKNSDVIVTDWRAPISSLYYDCEVGKCSYESPNGTIEGKMLLKRQYEIERGELKEYFDVDLVSNDVLLQKYLNDNNDSRLKSIVSTIQKEQNEVIRKKIFANLIIQGVAGSGKTTVALHRIAYLVYNYIKTIKQSQYLVIGPNPLFLKYIKSVLPELDVGEVSQLTYEEFAKNYINENIEISSNFDKTNLYGSNSLVEGIDKFKCSMKYKSMLDLFLNEYISTITNNDLYIDDFKVLDKQEIKKAFDLSKTEYTFSLFERIEKTINYLVKIIVDNKENILERYSDYSYETFIKSSNKEETRKKLSKGREEINKDCKTVLRKYFNKSGIKVLKLYKSFISNIDKYNMYNYENIDLLKKDTLKHIKSNEYEFEDLAALIYLRYNMVSNRYCENIRHVVIDEAQDFGVFNFYSLKKALPSSTFSIFGDLAQSIYSYRGIDNWEEVKNIISDNTEIISFNKSYRTTSEIMEVADDVAESIGLNKSEIVLRHGKSVEIDYSDNIPQYLLNKVYEYKNKGYKKIAIISKTDEQSLNINIKLKEMGLNVKNVMLNDDIDENKFEVVTISNQLAKGLEFDAVIINNANENVYSSDNRLDMKMLYVAITRALHELSIVYDKELTRSLKK